MTIGTSRRSVLLACCSLLVLSCIDCAQFAASTSIYETEPDVTFEFIENPRQTYTRCYDILELTGEEFAYWAWVDYQGSFLAMCSVELFYTFCGAEPGTRERAYPFPLDAESGLPIVQTFRSFNITCQGIDLEVSAHGPCASNYNARNHRANCLGKVSRAAEADPLAKTSYPHAYQALALCACCNMPTSLINRSEAFLWTAILWALCGKVKHHLYRWQWRMQQQPGWVIGMAWVAMWVSSYHRMHSFSPSTVTTVLYVCPTQVLYRRAYLCLYLLKLLGPVLIWLQSTKQLRAGVAYECHSSRLK